MLKILCVGNATWDRIYNVIEIPSVATKYFSTNYFEVGGGVAATAAVAAAKLGCEVEFIGRIGNDNVGKLIKYDLAEWGVKTTHSNLINGAVSSNAVVHVDPRGERQITVHRDPNMPRNADWITADMLEGVDCVLCDCTWSEGAEKLLTLAKEKGIPSVIDADLGVENLSKLLVIGEHIAFSNPALCNLTCENDLEKALVIAQEQTKGTVYVTKGEEGCYWLEDGQLKQVKGYRVDVIDTTGAGDVFHGALAVAVAQGNRGQTAVNFANAVAALKCTKLGGRAGIPNMEQAIKFIESNNKKEEVKWL